MAASVGSDTAAVRRSDGYAPIDAYAAIGDNRSVALVARDGSIDWLCLPDMDAPSFFGALIDAEDGGRWTLRPTMPYEVERRYVERTNVLETRFTTAGGCVTVTDAMSLGFVGQLPWQELVRRAECLAGQVEMEWRFEPRPRFAAERPTLTRGERSWLARCGDLQVGLQLFDAGEPYEESDALTGSFVLGEGDSALLALLASDGKPLPVPGRADLERGLDETVRGWRTWLGRHEYDGPWRSEVERSLLTLNLLTNSGTGAMAAAATTSLPEALGGERNYDYRFGWVRDTAFALDSFLRLGYEEIAHGLFAWLLRAEGHTHPRLNPVYRLDGTPIDGQQNIALAGWRGNTPVHIGNDADKQLQLGGWGDFVETAFMYARRGHVLDPETAARLADLADVIAHIWQRPDAGLWELGENAHYASSKVSCWQVLDRVLRLVQTGQVPDRDSARWSGERARVQAYIEERLWSEEPGSYVMKAGSDDLDAAVLLNSRRGFGDPSGERMQRTIDAIRAELGAGGPLLYRYSGMREEENAFLACSFWMAEALALANRREEAAALMDDLTALANDVGLFSEEMDPSGKEMRGNFPQALTHLSLVAAAAAYDKSENSS